ncbi:MAG: UDP-3-O-(3-hydroxymyristoyl)glucosamine N-acyltransferase [Calditrichaeota bacterium]|nr:MAG: UDP-3-O-(3-hydroxymyristoyl)glucosamine N-acyltransferase [Calditrichota bacterium]MBL1204240.1 UDP-3-O-(3-hydroxymyristoyl)glucosamine N-acyltransferase [Calditrichota bacterium]NOG44070.1 UDP-3-O-(3-hydroxymyristoyl)glucosamine N-acyltransferase [Calditrichota bacterium]
MKLIEIAKHLNGELSGPEDIEISGPAKIDSAKDGEITFLANPKYKHFIKSTSASAIVVDTSAGEISMPHIKVENAYMGFLLLLKLFEPKKVLDFEGISPKSEISESAKIGEVCNVGPFVFIGSNSRIGDNCTFYPGVKILDNVSIGSNTILYPNVSIRERCVIGDNVILHDGVVVGSDGFGFAPHDGKYIKIPQIGNVVVEDNVEIGANTTIDRATLGSTIIKEGVKLDNLVQIAHNCIVNEHTVIAAQTGIAGSTEVGKNVTIGGQAGIGGHLKLGDESIIAGQAGVTKDTPKKSILMGMPAIPIMQKKRIEASVKHLPENTKKLHQLETEVLDLKNKISELEKGNDQ